MNLSIPLVALVFSMLTGEWGAFILACVVSMALEYRKEGKP